MDEEEEAEFAGRAVLALCVMPGCPSAHAGDATPYWHEGLLHVLHHHARLDIQLWTGALILQYYLASKMAQLDASVLHLEYADCLWDKTLPEIYRLIHQCLQVSAHSQVMLLAVSLL